MVSITIRNVPQESRNELASRASREGRSLQEYLRGQLIALASRPDPEVVLERIRTRKELLGATIEVEQILADQDADRR